MKFPIGLILAVIACIVFFSWVFDYAKAHEWSDGFTLLVSCAFGLGAGMIGGSIDHG